MAVFRIHDILVWIRIRGSMPLTNGSGCGSRCGSRSCYFRHWPSRRQKNEFKKKISAYYFLKAHLHNFSKIKSPKEVTKQGFSYFFYLMIEGSGSEAGSESGSIHLTNGSGSGRPKICGSGTLEERCSGADIDIHTRHVIYTVPRNWIPERTISLRFFGIILTVLRIEVSLWFS